MAIYLGNGKIIHAPDIESSCVTFNSCGREPISGRFEKTVCVQLEAAFLKWRNLY